MIPPAPTRPRANSSSPPTSRRPLRDPDAGCGNDGLGQYRLRAADRGDRPRKGRRARRGVRLRAQVRCQRDRRLLLAGLLGGSWTSPPWRWRARAGLAGWPSARRDADQLHRGLARELCEGIPGAQGRVREGDLSQAPAGRCTEFCGRPQRDVDPRGRVGNRDGRRYRTAGGRQDRHDAELPRQRLVRRIHPTVGHGGGRAIPSLPAPTRRWAPKTMSCPRCVTATTPTCAGRSTATRSRAGARR